MIFPWTVLWVRSTPLVRAGVSLVQKRKLGRMSSSRTSPFRKNYLKPDLGFSQIQTDKKELRNFFRQKLFSTFFRPFLTQIPTTNFFRPFLTQIPTDIFRQKLLPFKLNARLRRKNVRLRRKILRLRRSANLRFCRLLCLG